MATLLHKVRLPCWRFVIKWLALLKTDAMLSFNVKRNMSFSAFDGLVANTSDFDD
jgi:hypothetical protein